MSVETIAPRSCASDAGRSSRSGTASSSGGSGGAAEPYVPDTLVFGASGGGPTRGPAGAAEWRAGFGPVVGASLTAGRTGVPSIGLRFGRAFGTGGGARPAFRGAASSFPGGSGGGENV